MTTHAHDTEGTGPVSEPRGSAQDEYPRERDPFAQPESTGDMPGAATQPLAREEIPSRPADTDDAPVGEVDRPAADAHPTQTSSATTTEESLFPADDLAGLRSRWNDVQAGFVDDPRRCVETADGLVSDVVQQLSSGFAHARSRLEDQWSRGEDVSTEDLRVALKRYREFFERLLAV